MSFIDLFSLKGVRQFVRGLAVLTLVNAAFALPAMAEDQVAISGEVNVIAEGEGEITAVGGEVKISGRSNDNIVAIGGQVEIDVQAEGETVVIGGEIDIDGAFAGNLVSFGGSINYRGANTEPLVLIGGEVTVHENAVSGGLARIFGGEVVLDGRFASDSEFGGGSVVASGQFADKVTISAREVIIEGEFYGDLFVEAETIHIKKGSAFIGYVQLRSPNTPEIDEGVRLVPGSWTYEYIEKYDPKIGDIALSDIIAILINVFRALMIVVALTALAAFAVVVGSNSVTSKASAAFRLAPGKSFLIGAATALITLVVGAFFLIIVIGPLLPLFIGFVGFFVAAYTLATIIFRKVGEDLSAGTRFGYAVAGTVFLLVLQIVPILGSLVVFVLSIIGAGAFVLALFNAAPGSGTVENTRFDDGREDFLHDQVEGEEPDRS